MIFGPVLFAFACCSCNLECPAPSICIFKTFFFIFIIYPCRYWHKDTKSLDFDGMIEDLSNAPEDSVIVLHAVAHNPTGKIC